MRDLFGFKRRREQFIADVLAQIDNEPRTTFQIARLLEEKRNGMVNVASLLIAVHELERRGIVAARWIGDGGSMRREYWRAV